MAIEAAVDVYKLLKSALSEKFETVIVSRSELKTADDAMRGQLMDSWEEKMIYDITRGVPKENLDDFTVCLGDSLGLDEEQRTELHARMKMMKFARSKDSSILEMNFNMDEMRSVYGFVSMVRENDGTIAIAYAFHKLSLRRWSSTPPLQQRPASFCSGSSPLRSLHQKLTSKSLFH